MQSLSIVVPFLLNVVGELFNVVVTLSHINPGLLNINRSLINVVPVLSVIALALSTINPKLFNPVLSQSNIKTCRPSGASFLIYDVAINIKPLTGL